MYRSWAFSRAVMHRYIAIIWDAEDCDSAAEALRLRGRITATSPWEEVYRQTGVAVIHQPPSLHSSGIHSFANCQGVIVGSVFDRTKEGDCSPKLRDVPEFVTQRIVASTGRYLVKNFWGCYVAIVRDAHSGRCSVMR